ncbi:UNVERIFIED_CONTAM: hypothetical protein K2H54_025777 [Gekko kuhli]
MQLHNLLGIQGIAALWFPLAPATDPADVHTLGTGGQALSCLSPLCSASPGPPGLAPLPPRRAMELGWACSHSVWLCFLVCLLKRLLRCDLLLTPRLLLHVGLVVLLQAVSHRFLPLPLSAALTGTACWLVLGGAARRQRIPAAGRAVFITVNR